MLRHSALLTALFITIGLSLSACDSAQTVSAVADGPGAESRAFLKGNDIDGEGCVETFIAESGTGTWSLAFPGGLPDDPGPVEIVGQSSNSGRSFLDLEGQFPGQFIVYFDDGTTLRSISREVISDVICPL